MWGALLTVTEQEMILHTLYENGADIEILDTYIKDDVERLGTRLNTIHGRMKSHLADLLVRDIRIYTIYNLALEVFNNLFTATCTCRYLWG
jgi:hypothetical protein